MELPWLGSKNKSSLSWVLGVVTMGILVVGATTYWIVRTREPSQLGEMTIVVQEEALRIKIQASGIVQPVQRVDISPKVSGRLLKFAQGIEQGEKVKAGQPLAFMERAELEARARQAEANLQKATADLKEVEIRTPKDIDKAQSRWFQSQDRLKEAQARIPEEIRQAQAQVNAAQAQVKLTQARLQRNQFLKQEGAIAQDTLDELITTAINAQETLAEAQRRLSQARNTNSPEINQLKAAVEEARITFEQERAGAADKISGFKALVEGAKHQRDQARLNLNDTVLTAPFDGIIVQKNADEGSFITPTTSASITDSATSTSVLAIASEDLELRIEVPEVDVGQLELGQPVDIVADAYFDEVFQGRIKLIAPEAIETNNVTSFIVRVELITGQEQLRSGMNVDVTFLGNRLENSVVVPTIALVTEQGELGVILEQNQKPKFQNVKIGLTLGNQTQILEGVEPGDRIFIDLPKGYRQ